MPHLSLGRDAFARNAWNEAYAHLAAADRLTPLEAADLELAANAAYLTGRNDDCVQLRMRAHEEYQKRGETRSAARVAFWLGFSFMQRGDRARGGGWISRAGRLLAPEQGECVEAGYLLLPRALGALATGDASLAFEISGRAANCGARFQDADLTTLGRLGQGQARVRAGDSAAGLRLLDEAMVAVESGEVSPIVAGLVYCAVIEVCQETFDMRRAQEWTTALSNWCDARPDLMPYRGQCLVRRSEIMRLHGAWSEAAREVLQACERLSEPPGEPAAGAAYYQKGELHRLRGEFDLAESAYREASRWGRTPQPGLALLRLATGDVDTAVAAMRRLLEEARDRRFRSAILPACVEIMLAAEDIDEAQRAANELEQIAQQIDAPLLRAIAGYARGVVLVAAPNAHAALDVLRTSLTEWMALDAPYDAARARVTIGVACRMLRDEDSATLEFDAARRIFEQLGALPDLRQLANLTHRRKDQPPTAAAFCLSARELQVLRKVAQGITNKSIAADLSISERTVERHISNIFNKLGVSSRSAATAFAYEHQLIQ